VAGAVMAAVAWGVEHELALALPGHGLLRQVARVGSAIGAGLAVLMAAARLLGVTEFTGVIAAVWRRLWGPAGTAV
jgi:hypothetical protein